MPSIAREKQQFYKARIRSLLAVDHQMTNEEVGRKLAAENIELDRGFLRKLINEVYRERTIRADHKTLSAALAAFEDTMTEIVRRAWEIVEDPMSERNEVLAALREIRSAHNDVFQKLFDAGVFNRKLGTIEAMVRNAPLPDEKRVGIREALLTWRLLPNPKEDAEATKPATSP